MYISSFRFLYFMIENRKSVTKYKKAKNRYMIRYTHFVFLYAKWKKENGKASSDVYTVFSFFLFPFYKRK